MKALSIYITLFSLMILLSCKKSNLVTFEKANLFYFSIKPVDSVSVNFAALSDDTKSTILKVPIALLGKQLETAAKFDLQIDEQLTTAVKDTDYQMPSEFIFPARQSVDTLRIKFNRTSKMENGVYVLNLELKSNNLFQNSMLSADPEKAYSNKLKIFVTDILFPPVGWVSTPNFRGSDYRLGPFSKKKLVVINSLFPYWSFAELYKQIVGYPAYFGDLLNNYLKAQTAKGTPVLENDGTPMKSGIFYN